MNNNPTISLGICFYADSIRLRKINAGVLSASSAVKEKNDAGKNQEDFFNNVLGANDELSLVKFCVSCFFV